MSSEISPHRRSPLIERLVDERDRAVRDRLLVDAVHASGIAGATALWREATRLAGAEEPEWHPIVARGDEGVLPGRGHLSAVAEGAVPSRLVPRYAVLITGAAPRRCALALADVTGQEEELDLVEALLIACSALDVTLEPAAASAPEDLADKILPPFQLPDSEPAGSAVDRSLARDLRQLLTCIRTTQELLAHYGDQLSDGERQSFSEVVERECERAGDMLIASFGDESPAPARGQDAPAGVRRSVPIAATLRETVAAESAALESAGARVEVRIDDDAGGLSSPSPEPALARVLRRFLGIARRGVLRVRLASSPSQAAARIVAEGDLAEPADQEGSLEALVDHLGGEFRIEVSKDGRSRATLSLPARSDTSGPA